MNEHRLDPVALARLRELDPDGRHDTVARVLRTYESSLTRQLVQLREAGARGDADAVEMLAHTAKSASMSVGALAFGAHCGRVELALRSGDTADLARRADALAAEGEHALEAVRAMLRLP